MPFLAQFGNPNDIAPMIVGVIAFMIPIIAILTAHQRKMAEIIHRGQSQGNSDEIAALRNEVARLTQAVHQNTIAIDSLAHGQALPPGSRLISEDPPQLRQNG